MDKHLIFIVRLLVFAMLHSFLAIPCIKERLIRFTGLNLSAYRLGYNIISLLAFGWVMAVDRQSAVLYEIPGAARYIFYSMQAALLFALASCLVNTGIISFLGLDALMGKTGDRGPQPLATQGWYGAVRHPLYLLSILFMFLNPVMTVRWLLLSCIATLYFIIGALIEEKRLLKEYGEAYIRYREQVPFIVPLLKKLKVS